MILYGVVEGSPEAPPLVLSSSLGTTHAMWDAQAAALAHGFRVIRYDHRGHGSSPVPPGPYAIADLGRDVLDLLDDLGLERVSFCGLSIGGAVGMWLAAGAPERIDRLVLACTQPAFPPAAQWAERAAAVRAGGTEVIADAVLTRWFTEGFRSTRPELTASFRQMLADTPSEGYAGCCEALGALDLSSLLTGITAPTLVISGEYDPVASPQAGEALAASIPGARHVVIPDAAHLASVEQPDAFTRAVGAFLEAGGPQ